MAKVYAIFAPLKCKGLYYTWEECKKVLDQCKNGHSFASFKKVEEAQEALRCGSLKLYRERAASRKMWLEPTSTGEKVVLPCLVVDAACSGAPGPTEYRGVVLPEGYEAFRQGPYKNGTNNIGEFLAIVTGLRWLESNTLGFPLYSDSSCAIGWVKTHGTCNSHCSDIGPELRNLISRAESWMRGPTRYGMVPRVRKWRTDEWGEIPADFGRK
jgi:ribonuclease HI